MNKKAGILGATGLVGSHLLKILLADESYDEVVAYTRKSLEFDHPKLREVQTDLLDESAFEGMAVDDLYCCIGTTQSKTQDLSQYKNIDFGIPVRAAKAGLKGGLKKYMVVSSMGADAGSRTFYLRTKGQMEDVLRKMPVPNLYIFRPSLLLGKRQEFRFGEKLASGVLKFIGWAMPKKYRGIEAIEVARAMHHAAHSLGHSAVFESDEIRRMAQSDTE